MNERKEVLAAEKLRPAEEKPLKIETFIMRRITRAGKLNNGRFKS